MSDMNKRGPDCCEDCEGERGERGKRGHRGPRGEEGPIGPTGPAGSGGGTPIFIPFAPGVALAVPLATVVGFGSVSSDSLEPMLSFVVPEDAALRTLRVNVDQSTIVGSVRFTIRRSAACNGAYVDTALEITVQSGVTGCFVATADIPVSAGDRISLRVVSLAESGAIAFSAGLSLVA
jgi:hypothetical protein